MNEEYEAVSSSAGVSRLPWRGVLEITGRDRVRFLHNLSTNDVLKLATGRDGVTFGKGERVDLTRTPTGRGQWSALTNRQGKMLAEFRLLMFEDCLCLDMDRSAMPAAMGHLAASIIMEDVRIADLSAEFVHLRLDGPRAPEILATALGPVPEVPEAHFEIVQGVVVSPFPLAGVPGYDLWPRATLADDLVSRLTRFGARKIGEATFETLRIEGGFPRWGIDMGPDMLPMEAGLEPIAVSYSKGCYLGQEVIQRVKTYAEPPERLMQLVIEAAEPPKRGEAVRSEDRSIGRVTSSCFSPREGKALALALVRKEFKSPGIRVHVVDTPAVVRQLPWAARRP